MAEFFGGRLLRWLTLPYRVGGRRGSRVINVASRPFYQVADRILGSQFLEDIAEFFLNFQSMYGGFVERANAVERLLHDRRTTFAVVTTLESAPLHEAEFFAEQLVNRDYHLGAMVLNRTLPRYLLSTDGDRAAEILCAESGPLGAELAETGVPALADPTRNARVLKTIGESFQNFAVVAKREAELRSELSQVPEVLADVPALDSDVGDMAGLFVIASYLFPTR
jgi:anion-transporting  ArsA/GET3 family ATPase